jgi:hypothetical protein
VGRGFGPGPALTPGEYRRSQILVMEGGVSAIERRVVLRDSIDKGFRGLIRHKRG